MSYTVGSNCEIIVDGQGYYVKPGSFAMKQPRVRKAVVRADGAESYTDLGPGKRDWSMIILCLNDLLNYDGTSNGLSGQQYRDALRTSYAKVATAIVFIDAQGNSISVRFDNYVEISYDLHSQQVALVDGVSPAVSYEAHITLVEV